MCFSSTTASTTSNTTIQNNNNNRLALLSTNVSGFCHERHRLSHYFPAMRALKKTTFILNNLYIRVRFLTVLARLNVNVTAYLHL